MRVLRPLVWLAASILVLLLAGCGDDVTIRGAPTALDYLRRAGVFISVATVILASKRILWGQAVRALYYAGYTLARTKRTVGPSTNGRDGHELYWKQAPKVARQFFHEVLRPLRNKWDYDGPPPDDEPIEKDLEILLEQGPDAFQALLDEIRNGTKPAPHHCQQSVRDCTYCKRRGEVRCVRADLDEAVSAIEGQLATLWSVDIPNALRSESSATNDGEGSSRMAP